MTLLKYRQTETDSPSLLTEVHASSTTLLIIHIPSCRYSESLRAHINTLTDGFHLPSAAAVQAVSDSDLHAPGRDLPRAARLRGRAQSFKDTQTYNLVAVHAETRGVS